MGIVLLYQSVSVDGYSAGSNIGDNNPLGENGELLHEWLFNESPDPVDIAVSTRARAETGAVVIGRRMYDVGVELWGDTPFPVPTFVLTHEQKAPRPMASATFTFIAGVAEAVAAAKEAAGSRDVMVMGGAGAAQEALKAGLVDEIQLQLVPLLLGSGTKLFGESSLKKLTPISVERSAFVTHLRYRL